MHPAGSVSATGVLAHRSPTPGSTAPTGSMRARSSPAMPERISLSELVEDLSIYPRGAVDNVRVDDLCYALDAGNVLPPPLVDRATRKIVDGFHRVRAYRKRLGDDGVIDAELEDFASDAEMLLRSAQLNAVHGK